MADFFVITSTAESHPLSLLEALAAGLPALGIAALGVEDSVTNGVNGLLCSEEVDEFAQKMVLLATDADLRTRLADGARRTRHRFDIRHTSARLLAHYERLVEEHRRKRNG